MPEYLVKRDSTFYFRRPVPKDVRAAIGKVQWMVTLKTKDRKEGERLARLEAVLCD